MTGKAFQLPRPGRRLVTALTVALVILGLTTGFASAHANLVRSNPPANATLATSPASVQLWFSEALEPSFSQVVVYDTNQQRVDAGDSHVDPNDPLSLIVRLKPNLPKGTYAIAWVTQSKVDGHIVRGIVPFGVGVTSVAPTPRLTSSVASGAVSGSPLEMALRWLILLAVTALIGSFAFWIVQETAGLPIEFPQQQAAVASWLLFLIGNIIFLLNQASIATGSSLLGAIGGPVLQVAIQTQYGRYWILRMLLGLAVGAILLIRRTDDKMPGVRRLDQLGVFVGGAMLLTVSLTSHSAAIGALTPLGVATDWLHLAATTVWVGGLLQFAVLMPALLRRGPGLELSHALGVLVPRFSVVAGASLGVVGLTGLAEALIHVGTVANLLDNGYGQALLVKIFLILPLIALAAVNHFVILPGFKQGRAATTPSVLTYVHALGGTFRWTARFELLFAVAVIAAAGVMTSLSPPQQFASSGSGPFNETALAGDLQVNLLLNPGRPGPNTYQVEVRDANGQLAADAQQVRIRFTFLDQNLGVTEVVLKQQGSGRFAGQSSDLAVAGRWEAEVDVRRPGRGDASAIFGFDVTSQGAQTLQAAALPLSWQFYVGLIIVVLGILSFGRGLWLRKQDLRRAAVVAVCGLCIGGLGIGFAGRDFQRAQAQQAASTQALAHPATAQSIADGAEVFRQNCAVCHGIDARGDGPMAPSLNPRPADLVVHIPLHPDGDLENWIANGFPGSAMPAFKGKLTDSQRWDVLNYLKSVVNASTSNGSAVGPLATPTP
ncbi:MAG TPA: copper resistance protein CopC [Chloroflexota bacterium]|nr:copper resistance protein CopC [Chloroflexota bacterium]